MSQPDRPVVLARIERRSIDVIPAAERYGTPRSQFTLWFGANMQLARTRANPPASMIYPDDAVETTLAKVPAR